MTTVDGKQLAKNIEDAIAKEVFELPGRRPSLAIIIVGDREDSRLYVKLKQREAKSVGIDTHLYECSDNISEEELIETIEFLNNDESVDGILLQLPLPDGVDTKSVVNAISSEKDVDGFTDANLAKLRAGDEDKLLSPVFGAVLVMLASIEFDIKSSSSLVIANADIFESNLAMYLGTLGSNAIYAKPDDMDLLEKMQRADLIVTAVGRPRYIKSSMIKDDAVLIDIGITHDKAGKLCGDVDFEDVKNKAFAVSPVPGGVGPLTIAMALKNTLMAYKLRNTQ